MATEKIIMVDRIPEKLSDEEMKKIREDYAAYCVETYKYVQNLDISNKDAKDIAFQHILSPFQYFVEDKVRLMRDRIAAPVQSQTGGGIQQPISKGPAPTGQQQQFRPKWKKY